MGLLFIEPSDFERLISLKLFRCRLACLWDSVIVGFSDMIVIVQQMLLLACLQDSLVDSELFPKSRVGVDDRSSLLQNVGRITTEQARLNKEHFGSP